MKYHLAGVHGNITTCKKVSHDVHEQFLAYLNSSNQKEQECEDAYKIVEENDDEAL